MGRLYRCLAFVANDRADWLPLSNSDIDTESNEMIKAALTLFKTYSALKQGVIVVLFLISLVGAFKASLTLYKHSIKADVVADIEQQERVIKDEDTQRVNNASAVVAGRSDCAKLSLVFHTDRCKERQGPPENNIQTTPAAEQTNPDGIRKNEFVVDRLPLPLGGVLQDKTEDESLCYEQPLMDEFGLPEFIYDGGEWVHEMIEICPDD